MPPKFTDIPAIDAQPSQQPKPKPSAQPVNTTAEPEKPSVQVQQPIEPNNGVGRGGKGSNDRNASGRPGSKSCCACVVM